MGSWVLDPAENREDTVSGETEENVGAETEQDTASEVENTDKTVDNSSENLMGGAKKLHLTAKVKNLSEKESSSDAYLGLLILADGNLYRGQINTSENMASGEEKEVDLEAVLPGDVTEEAIQVLVSFDGTWYQCK